MITPITQRQMLQTVAVEAVRAAQEGSELVQREVARKQFLDHLLAEDQAAVHQVETPEHIRLEEKAQERRREGKEKAGSGAGGEAGSEGESGGEAGSAESHLDFLA